MPNIVFLDSETLNHGDISWDCIEVLGNFRAYNQCMPQDVVERSLAADVIITNKVDFSDETFAALPNLQLICVAATGYDVIDTQAARRHGVTVCNCAGYGTNAVAQMTVAHILEVCNHVGHYVQTVKHEKVWCKSPTFSCWDRPLIELYGKKAAIVGYGAIGSAVGQLLQAFGMEIYAVSSKSQDELPKFVKKISLNNAFESCHLVSLNCPLTRQNRGFVNWQLLEHARKGLILVNTARGGLVEEDAICRALEVGTLKAYCADVLSEEPPAFDNKLLMAPNAYITPHVAWASMEARTKLVSILANNIKAFLDGKPVNVVN